MTNPSAPRTALKHKRQSLGLSQAQLAHEVGVTVTTISRIETGQCEPSAALLLNLADALGAKHSREIRSLFNLPKGKVSK